MLWNYNGAFSDYSKFAPYQLIDEMIEIVVMLFFAFHVLDGKLQLALYFS